MELIHVNRPGTPIAPVRDLTRGEIEALHRVARGASSDGSEALMRKIWQQRRWIACDCRAAAAKPPLLYVERNYAGDLLLSTMPDRPAHTKRCPFALPAIGGDGSPRLDRPSLPPLGQLLIHWITAAKLNVLYPYVGSDLLTRQYASLREVARSLSIAPGRTLFDFSRTHPEALPSLVMQLQRVHGQHRPSDAQADRDWGVLLLVVDTVVGRGLKVGGDLIELAVRDIETRAGMLDVGGPYAALLKYVAEPTGSVRLQQAFLQAVHSPYHLVPIEAAHERRTLKTLLRLQQKLLGEKDMLVVIGKALPDTQAYNRGIAFRLHRLGPNGRPVHEIDVLSVDATHQTQSPSSQCCPQDVVYHLVKQEVQFHDLDRRFFNIAFARLLDSVDTRARPVRAVAS